MVRNTSSFSDGSRKGRDAQALEELEAHVFAAPADDGTAQGDVVKAWLAKTDLRSWLALDPKLAKVDSGPYFYFSRDKALARIDIGRRLSQPLQEVLGRLLSDSDIERSAGIDAAAALAAEDFSQVYGVVLSRFVRDPRTLNSRLGPALVKVAALRVDASPALAKALQAAPVRAIQAALPLQISNSFSQGALPTELRELLQQWATQNDNPALKKNAQDALAGPKPQPNTRR